MFNGDISGINIKYNIIRRSDNISIFGYIFVNNNKNKCKLLINNKEYELTEKYNIKNYKKIY